MADKKQNQAVALPRYYNVTGVLPGRLEYAAGGVVPFLRALDVTRSGIGLELEHFLTPGFDVLLRRGEEVLPMCLIYCAYMPAIGTHRAGIQLVGLELDLVSWFRADETISLIPLKEEHVLSNGLFVDVAKTGS